MSILSSERVNELQNFISGKECQDIYRLIEMIDAGNMHGFDFSQDEETRASALKVKKANFELAGHYFSLGDEKSLKEARICLQNSLDCTFYFFPDEDDVPAMELLTDIDEKLSEIKK